MTVPGDPTEPRRSDDIEPTLPVTRAASAARVPSAPAPRERAGTLRANRFEVVRQLGEGGMGRVSLVRDRQIEGREVALKQIHTRWSHDEGFRRLFFQEIRSAQGFVSEHVVQVRDCGELPDGHLFVTMDYVDGEPLGELLARERTLIPRHALEVTRQILLGLSSGHERGFVHRDMKPSNVVLSARVPKTESNPHGVHASLLDFGLAAHGEELDHDRGSGTPRYMSPEQASGERIDARSDLFSVGVMLFEMITGRVIFDGRTTNEIRHALIEIDPAPLIQELDGLTDPIKRILRRALQKEREKRFASAADFIEAIESSATFKAEKGGSRWVAGVAAASLLSTVALGGLLLETRISANDERDRIQRESRALARTELEALHQQRVDEFTARFNQQEARTRDAERQRDETARERDLRVAEITGLAADLKAERARSADLAAQVEASKSTVVKSGLEKNATEIEALKEGRRNRFVIEALSTELKDTTALVAAASDHLGARLLEMGRVFDGLARDIAQGRVDATYRRFEHAVETRTVAATLPEVETLRRLEALAVDTARFEAGVDAGESAFARLPVLRSEHERLAHPATVAEFAESAGGVDADAARRGRWLALERRTDEELLVHLLTLAPAAADRVDEASTPADETAAPAPADADAELGEGELTTEEKRLLRESLATTSAVENKRLLLAELDRQDPARIHEVLYRARVSDDLRAARVLRYRDALAALGARLDAQDAKVRASAAERAAALASIANLDERAGAFLEFTAAYGTYADPFAGGLLAGLVQDLEGAIVAGGALGLDGLRAAPFQLRALADYAEAADLAALGLERSTFESLAWLTLAHAWYVEAVDGFGEGWLNAFRADLLARPTTEFEAEWRRRLAFELQLSERCGAAGLLPGGRTKLVVFADHARKGDACLPADRWALFERTSRDGAEQLVTTRLAGDGGETGAPNVVDLASRGPRTVVWAGTPLLRLGSLGDQVGRFARWAPLAGEARGAFEAARGGRLGSLRRGIVPAQILRREYGGRWNEGDPIECLQLSDDRGNTYWIHPVLGVVRQELALRVFDLVHLED